VVLESDNVGVVDAIKRRNQKLSTLRRTYDEIEISEARFGNFKVINNIRRESNQEAHDLAKLARLSDIAVNNF
jgi:hypothetical protein